MFSDLRDDDFFFYFNMSGNILTYASAGAQLIQLDIIYYLISSYHLRSNYHYISHSYILAIMNIYELFILSLKKIQFLITLYLLWL